MSDEYGVTRSHMIFLLCSIIIIIRGGFATRGIFLLGLFHCVCVRKKSLTLAASNNLFPRIRPRRRKLTPLIAPSESNAYASDRLIPKRACNPGQSTNSASRFAGDAVTGAIVVRALPSVSLEFFIAPIFRRFENLAFPLIRQAI